MDSLSKEHSLMVSNLKKDGEEILQSLTPQDCSSLHMVAGIAGEAGELLDALKKAIFYRKPLDRDNVIEELGDLEFFMEGLRADLGITREETIEANIKKLGKRYHQGAYSDQQAQERVDKQ